MVVFCFMVLACGAFLAVWMPLIHFALGLAAATVASAVLGSMTGVSTGPLLGWSLVFFILAQVGYGFGFGGLAILTRWRKARAIDRTPQNGPEAKTEAPTRGN